MKQVALELVYYNEIAVGYIPGIVLGLIYDRSANRYRYVRDNNTIEYIKNVRIYVVNKRNSVKVRRKTYRASKGNEYRVPLLYYDKGRLSYSGIDIEDTIIEGGNDNFVIV